MNKFFHWIAKNKTLARWLFILPLYGISVAVFWINHPLWLLFYIPAFALIGYLFPEACQNTIVHRATLKLDQECDATPLIIETAELLTYKNGKVQQQILLMNHAVGLRCIGKFQPAYDMLSSINIDQYSTMLNEHKIIYYNNLADLCDLLGRPDEATIWFLKAKRLFEDSKNKRFRAKIYSSIVCSCAEEAYRQKDYQAAIELLNSVPTETLRMDVGKAFLYAKCFLALGDEEHAKENLEFTIQYGNTLFHAQEAKQLLEQL